MLRSVRVLVGVSCLLVHVDLCAASDSCGVLYWLKRNRREMRDSDLNYSVFDEGDAFIVSSRQHAVMYCLHYIMP